LLFLIIFPKYLNLLYMTTSIFYSNLH
jgi:hypothetical protein